MAEQRELDTLTDAKESLREYWEWEEQLDPGTTTGEQKKIEHNQHWLLERAKVSALVSIAESLAMLTKDRKDS